MKNRENEQVCKEVIKVIQDLAKKHGTNRVRTAVRRWDKNESLKRKLSKQKDALDRELAAVSRKLG